MVRDYISDISALAPDSPMRFASNYYLHYPKVGLGHWPPLFYLVQAGWLLLFQASQVSVMALMAVLTAGLATMVCQAVRKELSTMEGVAVGVLLVCTPLVQLHSRMVMAEILETALVFWATLAFARYLDTESWRYAMWFGVAASLACLTKAVAFLLVLVPPLSVLISRRFGLLATPSFWLPAVIVAAACAPWYLLAPAALHQGTVLPYGRFAFIFPLDPFWTALQMTHQCFEWILLPLIGIGIFYRLGRPLWRREEPCGIWVTAAAIFLSLPLFGAYVQPAREPRHFIVVIPSVLLFLAAGIQKAFSTAHFSARWKVACVAVLIAVLAAMRAASIPKVSPRGYRQIARHILSDPKLKNTVLLISSDGLGEGMLIAEIARQEAHRPGHIVLRATKMLASADRRRLVYSTPAELMEFFRTIPVGLLVLDLSVTSQEPHQRLLRATLDQYRDCWELAGVFSQAKEAGRGRSDIHLYRLIGSEAKEPGRIRIDMTSKLGRVIEN